VETVENKSSGRAVARLRERFRFQAADARPRPGEGVTAAGLLVGVSDAGGVTARKLVWLAGRGDTPFRDRMRESANLPSRGDATLGGPVFRQAIDDLGGPDGVVAAVQKGTACRAFR
jgi:hypothetical protein